MIILFYCKHDKKKTWEKNLYWKSARYGNMIGNKQFLFKFNPLMQIAYHILYIFQSVLICTCNQPDLEKNMFVDLTLCLFEFINNVPLYNLRKNLSTTQAIILSTKLPGVMQV